MWENLFLTKECYWTDDRPLENCKHSKKLRETDICNADEFGLFYKALPKKPLDLKDDKWTGGKHSTIRVTGLAPTNINGDKLPTFVIGKSKKPRCFKNVKNCLVDTKSRTKAGWVPRFLKIGSESLTINL